MGLIGFLFQDTPFYRIAACFYTIPSHIVGDSLEVSLPYIMTLEDTSYAQVPLTSQVAIYSHAGEFFHARNMAAVDHATGFLTRQG
jgi:hypothetical protein